jgi:hypothetical protein
MIIALIVGLLALASIVATIRTVSIDGYRRIPFTPVARLTEYGYL